MAAPDSPPSPDAAARADDGDDSLVRRLAAGSEEALAGLYRRYASLVLGLVQRILGDAAEAEEVVQETFLQAWRQAGRYEAERSSVSTWLVLIARSRAIDRLRTRRVGERTVAAAQAQDPGGHASPAAPADVWMLERRSVLRQALAELPPEQKLVVDLAFYQGLTQREIAEQTGIPLGTVKTRTLLAMRKLKTSLGARVKELL